MYASSITEILQIRSEFCVSDVKFAVDDGIVHAHRSLLMVRCDVMTAMFSDNFRESSAHIVSTGSYGTNNSDDYCTVYDDNI